MEQKPLAWSKLGAHLADADKAREYLEFLRWGKSGPACPHCGGADPNKIERKAGSSTRKGLYRCRIRECRTQFTVTVGTVFEDSGIPLNKWLQAICLVGVSKKGMSAHQLHRMVGVTYRSASFMVHRLRHAMSVEPMIELLSGTVEADETIGGRAPSQSPLHPFKAASSTRPMAKRGLLHIPLDFETTVKALLQIPPPPADVQGSRKGIRPRLKARKGSKRKAAAKPTGTRTR